MERRKTAFINFIIGENLVIVNNKCVLCTAWGVVKGNKPEPQALRAFGRGLGLRTKLEKTSLSASALLERKRAKYAR